MTKVKVKILDNLIEEVLIKGHSMFATHGSDIVCASVSTCVITSENLLSKLGFEEKYLVEMKDAYLKIKVLESNELIQAVLKNMLDIFEDLEKQYPKNIKLEIGG